MPDQLTTMTDFHVALIDMLERMGLGLMYEVPFPPYQVDVYVPDAHAAIEADGPFHGGKRDAERDRVLWNRYKLAVMRVDATWFMKRREAARNEVWEFVTDFREDAEDRFEAVRDRVPWL